MHSFYKRVRFPFISIISVSRNAAKTINETIESAKSQNFKSFEHIIIDGASTDGTCEVIESHLGTYPLQYISEKDSGIADAMNKGVKLSRGRYILILHADDYLPDCHSIGTAASYLVDECYDIYTAPVFLEYMDGRRVLRKPYPLLFWYHFKTPFCHQGTFVHRRVFDEVGLFQERFSIAMDYDFFYRVLKLNPRILYRKQPLAVMGAYGVGTRKNTILKRIEEEYKVQTMNEKSRFWKIMQSFFHVVHRYYKIRIATYS